MVVDGQTHGPVLSAAAGRLAQRRHCARPKQPEAGRDPGRLVPAALPGAPARVAPRLPPPRALTTRPCPCPRSSTARGPSSRSAGLSDPSGAPPPLRRLPSPPPTSRPSSTPPPPALLSRLLGPRAAPHPPECRPDEAYTAEDVHAMEELCARHSLPGEQAQDTFPRYSQTLPRTFLATDRQKVLRQPLAPLATRPAPATAPLPSPSPVARSSSRPRSASPSRISTRWPTCCGACLARSSSSGRGPARCSHKTARKTCSQTAPAPAAAPRPSQHGDGAASSGADPRLVPLSDARHAARGESRNHPPLRPLPSSSLALRPVVRPLPPPRSNPLPPPPMRAGWRRGPLRLRRRPRRDRVAACAGGPALLPLLRPPAFAHAA